MGAVTKRRPVNQSNLGIIQPFHEGIATPLIARTYYTVSLCLASTLCPPTSTLFVSPKCYNSKIAFKLPNRAARWLIKHAGHL